MILVAPDPVNRFKGSWYLNSIVSGNWQDYIVYDVVQFVDNTYRTIANSESRGIMGHSMGGYGTVMIAMKYPEIFNAVHAHASWGLAFESYFGSGCTWESDTKSEFEEIANCNNLDDFDGLSRGAQVYAALSVAMVPNPSVPPFYFDPLYNSNGEKVDSVLQRFYSYDPSRLVLSDKYKENLLKLNAFKLECGIHDESRGLYNGNIYFKSILESIGIEDALVTYDGGHNDKVFERVEFSMLPFFSEHLVHEN